LKNLNTLKRPWWGWGWGGGGGGRWTSTQVSKYMVPTWVVLAAAGSAWPSDKGDGAAEMRWTRLAYLVSSRLVSSRTVPFARGPLKGMMFFSSIKGRASPSLVFPCTYIHLWILPTPPLVNTTNHLLVFKKPSSINRSPSSFRQSIARSLARSLKTKNFQCFFSLFCFFVNTCFGHSELRVCFLSFLSSKHIYVDLAKSVSRVHSYLQQLFMWSCIQ